jgi:hypothetical protein
MMSHNPSRSRRRIGTALVAAAALLGAQCGKSATNPAAPSTPASPTVSTVSLSVSTATLNKQGATAQVTANATMSSGASQDVTSSCSGWASDNASVASIGATGLLTARASGSTTITTVCQGVQGRTLATLSVATQATPDIAYVSAGYGWILNYTQSSVLMKLRFAETGKVYGFDFTSLTMSVRVPGAGSDTATASFGPSYFTPTNHWSPDTSSTACFAANWGTSPHPTSIELSFNGSVQDDLGKVFTFSGAKTLPHVTETYTDCNANQAAGTRFILPIMPTPEPRF